MAERSEVEIEEELVAIDRRLRGIQLGLAPGREPAPVREPALVKEPAPANEPAAAGDAAPSGEPAPPPNPDRVVTTKLIASMRELLDALEGSIGS